MFYYLFLRETGRAWVGEGQREKETQNLKQASGSELSEPDAGLELMNREVTTWAEVGHVTIWTTQASHSIFFKLQKKNAIV